MTGSPDTGVPGTGPESTGPDSTEPDDPADAIPDLPGLIPDLPMLLAQWMPRQRWFPLKGTTPRINVAQVHRLRGPSPGGSSTDDSSTDDSSTTAWVCLVDVTAKDATSTVQVPLTVRTSPLAQADQALIATAQHRRLGEVFIYDGTHDPLFVDALLGSLDVPADATRPPTGRPARVLRGEQSNTSIIVGADPPGDIASGDADSGAAGRVPPVMLKVFRTVNPGRNPDVEVVGALSAAGCDAVPRLLGSLSAQVPGADGPVTADLAVATEFCTDGQDAWREALTSAGAGQDYAVQAHSLGQATARVHLTLRDVFGEHPSSLQQRRDLAAGLKARVRWALAEADALSGHREQLEAHLRGLASVAESALPPLQRIHGDYHLGQVLHSPRRGWMLLDFEGEPLRPLAQRTLPDLALRDVVGMLRSFDYAAGHVAIHHPDRAGLARDWASATREAFLAGYAEATGTDPLANEDLYVALWLDKALYEVVYETRNRPDWIDIPLQAVARVL